MIFVYHKSRKRNFNKEKVHIDFINFCIGFSRSHDQKHWIVCWYVNKPSTGGLFTKYFLWELPTIWSWIVWRSSTFIFIQNLLCMQCLPLFFVGMRGVRNSFIGWEKLSDVAVHYLRQNTEKTHLFVFGFLDFVFVFLDTKGLNVIVLHLQN